MKYFDAHINLASTDFVPVKFIIDNAKNMYNKVSKTSVGVSEDSIINMLLSKYQDHDANILLKEMDSVGIDKAILLAPDFSNVTETKLSPNEIIIRHHQISEANPGRFIPFCGVDPRNGKDGIDRFENAIKKYGHRGMKLYPPAGYSPSDERLFPYYEICEKEGIPVLTHSGPGWNSLDFSMGNPMLLDKASRIFSKVNFILGHGGVSNTHDACNLCKYRENVYMDISGFTATINPKGWVAHLNDLFKIGLNHKILFGSSWPASRMSISLKEIMKQFEEGIGVFAGVSNVDRELISYKNVSNLLNI